MYRLVIVLLFVGFVGCSISYDEPVVYKPVLRVFMHQPNVYSFMVRDTNEQLQVIGGPYTDRTARFLLIDDVKKGESSWVKVTQGREYGNHVVIYEIHIHSAADVEGGEYKPLKARPITTRPLE